MASPASSPELLGLFERLLPPAFWVDLIPKTGTGSHQRIYSFAVVVWLMIVQRLDAKGTLGGAVQQMLQQRPASLLADCKRVREGNISPHAGAYCQARLQMPIVVARQVSDHILAQLMAELPACPAGCQQPVFLLDGSALDLAHTPELVDAYPPAQNQHGTAHWPIVRIAVMHNLANGLALRPSWGPMYGPQAVSEQALAEELMDRLPAGAVMVADRNFGVFSIAHAASVKQLPVILRLTRQRFEKLAGAAGAAGQDQFVTWRPSQSDRRTNPQLPAQAAVTGRLLVAQMQTGSVTELLYLFITLLTLSAEQILELYRCRWNIETDLRSLKTTIRLEHIRAKTIDGMEKELLLAFTAYNLVRAVMGWAAEVGIAPRALSFSQVQDVVRAALPLLAAADSPEQYQLRFQRMLHYACRCKLPQRSQRRSFPRLVWRHRPSFPNRKPTPEEKTI
jgi:hypothetical protein